MKGFAERADHKAARGKLGMAQHALMIAPVIDDVLVDLVRQHHDVGVAGNVGQRVQITRRKHRAGGIVRGVDDDHACTRRHRIAHTLPIDIEIGQMQGHVHGLGALQFDGRLVAVIGRVEDDHFVACAHDGGDGREQRFGGARSDRDLTLGADPAPVKALGLERNLLAQRRNADARCVLVAPFAHGPLHRFTQAHRRFVVGEALPQIHRLVLDGQLAHHGKDSGSDLGQFGLNLHEYPAMTHANRVEKKQRLDVQTSMRAHASTHPGDMRSTFQALAPTALLMVPGRRFGQPFGQEINKGAHPG